MTRFAIRGLLSRKLRTGLTAIAIVLGVAMISGTYVLTDSIDRRSTRSSRTSARAPTQSSPASPPFDLQRQHGLTAPTLDESLLPQVRALPGVAQAEGSVDTDAT